MIRTPGAAVLATAAPTWTRILFRVVMTIEALLAFGQAVLAGSFLSGHYAALSLHEANASATAAFAVLQTVAAVLLWRPGRGPMWPAAASVAVIVAVALQIHLGYSHDLAIHIPLGTAIIAAIAALTVWAWRPAKRGDA